jgi:hypothetical protein
MKRIVRFYGNRVLLLEDLQYANGALKSAWVVNGAWPVNFETRGDTLYTKHRNTVVSEIPSSHIQDVDVIEGIDGNYNEIIAWAEKELKKQENC